MSHSTSIRRSASALGATGLIALSLAGTASARQVPGNGGSDEQHCSVSCYQGGSPAATTPRTDAPTSGSMDYLQLGAGLLAGLALAGGGAVALSRRGHGRMAHPA